MNYARHREKQKQELIKKRAYLASLNGEERTNAENKIIAKVGKEDEQENNISDSGSNLELRSNGEELGSSNDSDSGSNINDPETEGNDISGTEELDKVIGETQTEDVKAEDSEPKEELEVAEIGTEEVAEEKDPINGDEVKKK